MGLIKQEQLFCQLQRIRLAVGTALRISMSVEQKKETPDRFVFF